MGAPRGAREDWRLLEAAGFGEHGHGAHTDHTHAMSCEKDLIVLQPIDAIGKKHIGRIIIVEPDAEDEDAFLRQGRSPPTGWHAWSFEATGPMRSAPIGQAWSNASMVEHSMRVAMLARQANLKT